MRLLLTCIALLAVPVPALPAEKVPFPEPRPRLPADAAPAADATPAKPSTKVQNAKPSPDIAVAKPAAPAQTVPEFTLSEMQACEGELRKRGVKFTIGDDIADEPPCGIQRPVMVQAFSRGIEVAGKPIVNCVTALAADKWLRETVEPSASLHLGSKLKSVEISTSYQCRRRNNRPDGKLSEHAFGNGLDIMAYVLEDGRRIDVRERDGGREAGEMRFQAAARGGACAYFTTVLGPGANSSHATHFHVDLAIRRGGYRLCQ